LDVLTKIQKHIQTLKKLKLYFTIFLNYSFYLFTYTE